MTNQMNTFPHAGKKIGVIGIPGKWSTEVLADALESRTGFRRVIDIAKVSLELSGMKLMHDGLDLCELDGLAVKKITAEYSPSTLDRIELLSIAEARGVRVFSKARNIHRLVNRLSCTLTLRQHAIPMPETIITENPAEALKAVYHFGEAVFKPLFSTKARGMEVMHHSMTEQETVQKIRCFQETNPLMYIQKKVNLPGRDLGMVFLGGTYLGTYARVSQSDTWNTTIHNGGKYAAFDPPESYIELARRAQAPFGMDFTTVDVAETDDGPIVFEVSAFGGFKGALEGAGIQAAELYADYIINALESGSKNV